MKHKGKEGFAAHRQTDAVAPCQTILDCDVLAPAHDPVGRVAGYAILTRHGSGLFELVSRGLGRCALPQRGGCMRVVCATRESREGEEDGGKEGEVRWAIRAMYEQI